jgi:hypothetical protein
MLMLFTCRAIFSISGLSTGTPSLKVLFGCKVSLAALSDAGIPIYFFTGNHDMWMFDYFEKEIGVVIYRKPIELQINTLTAFLIGMAMVLAQATGSYKILKQFFNS